MYVNTHFSQHKMHNTIDNDMAFRFHPDTDSNKTNKQFM